MAEDPKRRSILSEEASIALRLCVVCLFSVCELRKEAKNRKVKRCASGAVLGVGVRSWKKEALAGWLRSGAKHIFQVVKEEPRSSGKRAISRVIPFLPCSSVVRLPSDG